MEEKDRLEKILISLDGNVDKYIIKKKRQMLCNILFIMGANINLNTSFPMKICLSELETDKNKEILEYLCSNTIINKYFSCRSLTSLGEKDKKRIQNVIKQMFHECELNVKRTPVTLYNKLTNDKVTKQYYVITV